MVGTDLWALAKAVYFDAEIYTDFLYGSDMFTPLEELPESTRLLYEYNPDLAIEMLADAGYPNGFDMELYMNPASIEHSDLTAFLVDQWAKIGVNATLVPLETTAYGKLRINRLYTDAYMDAEANSSLALITRVSDNSQNSTCFSDPFYDAEFAKGAATIDAAERNTIFKGMIQHYLDEVSRIPMPTCYYLSYMWPWVKNYYGEVEISCITMVPVYSRLWIDQDLKEEMGF